MANTAKRYDPDFKEMVCKRLTSSGKDRLSVTEAAKEFDVTPSTLYNWLHRMHYNPMPVSMAPEAPLPRGISTIRDALYVSMHCERLGFDSTDAGLFCRQNGYYLEDIKKFSQWAQPFEDEKLLKQFPTMAATVNNTMANYEKLQSDLKESQSSIAKKDKVIAELTTELVLRKKLEAILS